MTGKEFSQWMDRIGISLAEAADLFGVSEATLYNWRSTVGVPTRKLEWVRARMADFEKSRQKIIPPESIPRESRPGFFEIFRNDEEFHRADMASRIAGAASLSDWCHDVIMDATNRILETESFISESPHKPGASSPGESEVA